MYTKAPFQNEIKRSDHIYSSKATEKIVLSFLIGCKKKKNTSYDTVVATHLFYETRGGAGERGGDL